MTVHLETGADGVAVVRMARPPVNAVDLDAILAMTKAFSGFSANSPKAVILTGEGAAFSAGVDTRAFAGYDAAQRRALPVAITRMVEAMVSLPCPLVAAVNGHALGGGMVLMLCADYRVAVDAAEVRCGLPEAKAGVPFPAGPLEIIAAELPPGLLRTLTLTSATLPPAAFHAAGVIDALVPLGDLLRHAHDSALAMAAQPAFATVKRQVRGSLAAKLRALAASGDEPFADAFG